ncbi:MAG: 1-acyl-sn-glycerol-3-phosphate acyltransferase [Comamonadaceae bacterium]|nr:MAG: 1-acyl-sn-glycerol-3-phosphate acyltransferase [Comamonadaceae bacterium]
MKLARALARALRVTGHALSGLFAIWLKFPKLATAEREAVVHAWAAQLVGKMGIELVVEGTPCLSGPMLLVSNHVSWLDIPVMHAARYCRFVSKSDVRHWPLIGMLATGAGTLYIERESRRDALRTVHRMAESLRAGDVVAIFPEGTTGDGIELLPFHANLLQAAISAEAPVQPVALKFIDAATGAHSSAPSFVGDETLVGSMWRTFSATGLRAVVRFGEPQAAQGRDRRAWAADLRTTIEALKAPAQARGNTTT